MKTAVLFLVFNRPELASRVFEKIRKAKPEKLFIMADGPRPGVAGDKIRCSETRELVSNIDWECAVQNLFFDENRGCGRAVVDGINWFFENVEQGIILEDDCLPDSSFFSYCEVLLNHYKNEPRIMHINGNNFNTGEFTPSSVSYHFGSYPQAWGWATWKRSWVLFDFDIASWPEIKENGLLSSMKWKWYEKIIQKRRYEELYRCKRKDVWDYQWHLALFHVNGLTIVPKVNLISNIGFGPDATHTKNTIGSCTDLETKHITFPLNHPELLVPDNLVDKAYRRIIIGTQVTLFRMVKNRLKSISAKVFN